LPAPDAYRAALRGIDQDAQELFGAAFLALSCDAQDAVLRNVQHGAVRGEAWRGLSARRFFADVLLSDVLTMYYAHPDAWSEIGFGGPASPRGYVRLELGQRDPWEAKQRTEEGSDER
jgi:hypothetical protein